MVHLALDTHKFRGVLKFVADFRAEFLAGTERGDAGKTAQNWPHFGGVFEKMWENEHRCPSTRALVIESKRGTGRQRCRSPAVARRTTRFWRSPAVGARNSCPPVEMHAMHRCNGRPARQLLFPSQPHQTCTGPRKACPYPAQLSAGVATIRPSLFYFLEKGERRTAQ